MNTDKLFNKHASVRVKGFATYMTETDFEQAIAELLIRLKQHKHKPKKKV